jgi:hypothetical protein
VALVWNRQHRPVAAASSARAQQDRSSLELPDPAGQDSEPSADTASVLPSSKVRVSTFLANYFGDRWDEVRELTKPSQALLDSSIDPSLIPPWPEVAPEMLADLDAVCRDNADQIRNALAWNEAGKGTSDADFSAMAYNPDGKTLAAPDVARIRAALKSYDDEIGNLAKQRSALELRALQNEFDKGRYEAAPILRVMPNRLRRGRLCSLKVFATNNWNMTLGFVQGDSPEFDAVNATIQDLREARLQTALELIADTK